MKQNEKLSVSRASGSTISTYLWIKNAAGKNLGAIGILSILQMFIGISGVLSALVLRYVIDMAVKGNVPAFWKYTLYFAAILILQILIRAVIRYLEESARSEMENRFKKRLFAELLNRDFSSVTKTHSEEWMNRLTSDTVVVADGLVQIFPGLVCMLVKMIGAFTAILVLDVRLAYVLIPGGFLLMFVTYGFRKVLKKLHKDIQETDGKLRIFLQERLGSLMIVKTFAKEAESVEKAQEKMQEHKAARMRRNHFSNVCNVGFATAMNGIYFLGTIFCGYGILQGTMSYGTFVAITQLIGQVQNPLANITGYFPKYYAMLASAERLQEAEGFQVDAKEQKSQMEIAEFYRRDFGGIGLRDVSFTYRKREDSQSQVVLHDMNLLVGKGEYVAITGTSGCGKSTLLKLFMCLYPVDSGECYLSKNDRECHVRNMQECHVKNMQGCHPKDLQTCRLEDVQKHSVENIPVQKTEDEIPLSAAWRGLYAYVPQGNQLLSGTIREVVSFGDPVGVHQDDKLWWALKVACADFVFELEEGLDTLLGERGAGLSEGQMQRIAIARAVFSEHPILMLDEATSSLDEGTERKVLDNLRSMTDRTVLIVTHRLAVLDICDRQVEMTEGEVQIKELN